MGHRLPPDLVRTAFFLILVGFGTKTGLVPMHTWLPDAHSQAPSPVCTLLSGVKTTVCLYPILRLLPILPGGSGEHWFLIFGYLSVGVAAFLLLQVHDYKRMFAFSTVEHMGIVCSAVGLGVPAARYAAIRVIYRRTSRHNVLFVTERCNSRCVMCSQPPRDLDDGYLVDEILQAISLMSPDTPQLCITGGEPTLYFDGLLKIVDAVKHHLPRTSLHMLSNGRLFSRLAYAKSIASLEHPDFMIGIPLYGDVPERHDYVVQSQGAFDETIFGLLNLARYRQKVEIRFVIHRETLPRMVETARFIARNLTFASHVALMGLEPTGFAKTNFDALWVDPWDYRSELEKAASILQRAGLRTSIYNHQLCILSPTLWSIATQSISDWKNVYLEECEGCSVKAQCGGFFSSNRSAHSMHLNRVQ